MKTTEKKHWLNGHDIRGGWFHTWAWTDGTYGVMFSWGWKYFLPTFKVNVYKLI